MVFNDSVNYSGLVNHIDFLLFGDGTTFNADYSLADRTRNINAAYDDFTAILFKADPNFMWDDTTNSDLPCAKTDLVANQQNYTTPDGSLVVHRLRMFDKSGNFKTLTPVQRRELSDSKLASTGEPDYYYKLDNAFFPIPIPDYGGTLGVEFQFQRAATHFVAADTVKVPGFASIFHQILAIDAALVYAVANGMREKMATLTNMKNEIIQKVSEHYQRRSPDRAPALKLKRKNYGNGL